MIMAKNQMKQIRVIMERNGFQLSRETKHFIWKHHTGVVMTTSKTPSDNYATAQITRQIRRTLGEVV
jgi:predicted RNA binding protein YcfA (HicA-like mRNA interferase family)